ncbi:histidine kinase [Paenibacillus sp. FSL R7-0337]|uniref:sensor histidine kinase n=1 Tax=Paenibacillus sp. FSL R7-0337 TaxID=1926588 RepID=UPI00096F04E8|nr:histidine kinase [Paenibacillus sp. FSL R7-0337]OMG00500.1 sensor histidine kinase [Paenibacillus sp. FSL R7-0337]
MIRTNSIVFKFSLQMTVILAILLSILVLSNIYSLEVVRSNALTSSRNTLALYQANIHNNFNNFSKDLIEVFDHNVDAAVNSAGMDENSRYFRVQQLKNSLQAKIAGDNSSDGMFIRLSDELVLEQFNRRIQSEDKLALVDFINMHKFSTAPAEHSGEWKVFQIRGESYLFKYITYSEVSFGTLVKADTLLAMVDRGGNDQNRYVLSDSKGTILAASNISLQEGETTLESLSRQYKRDYLIVSEPIGEFGQMTQMVAKGSLFSGLKLIQWGIALLAVLSVIVVPLVLRFLTRDVLRPILELVKAAKAVEQGQLEYQIPQNTPYSLEFLKLFHALESMVSEIKDLKIQSYEEQIEISRAEIKYLQMQIRPHFFLNAISTITSLSYQNKNEEIRRLIHCLSEHLRYMFRGGLMEVTMEEEIRHTENYIRMQEIRYPEQIFFMIEIQEEARQVPVPQFMIQTFVENTFKHAMFVQELLSIFIRVRMEQRDDSSFVSIVIEDNGAGFASEWLDQPEREEAGEDGGRVGIANIRKTLRLLYKREDLLKLSNNQSTGARVELWIPVKPTEWSQPGLEGG